MAHRTSWRFGETPITGTGLASEESPRATRSIHRRIELSAASRFKGLIGDYTRLIGSTPACFDAGRSMRHISRLAAVVLFAAVPLLSAAEPVNREALLNQYCLACHNSKTKSGNLLLEGVSPADPSAHPETWERVVRKLSAGEMP